MPEVGYEKLQSRSDLLRVFFADRKSFAATLEESSEFPVMSRPRYRDPPAACLIFLQPFHLGTILLRFRSIAEITEIFAKLVARESVFGASEDIPITLPAPPEDYRDPLPKSHQLASLSRFSILNRLLLDNKDPRFWQFIFHEFYASRGYDAAHDPA
jgi:hypothetical protein